MEVSDIVSIVCTVISALCAGMSFKYYNKTINVINGNYTDRDIQTLNTAERYATAMGLTLVDDDNLEKVRGFVTRLGAEFVAIFDAIWTHGDESKLERLAEAKLAEMPGGGIRR